MYDQLNGFLWSNDGVRIAFLGLGGPHGTDTRTPRMQMEMYLKEFLKLLEWSLGVLEESCLWRPRIRSLGSFISAGSMHGSVDSLADAQDARVGVAGCLDSRIRRDVGVA